MCHTCVSICSTAFSTKVRAHTYSNYIDISILPYLRYKSQQNFEISMLKFCYEFQIILHKRKKSLRAVRRDHAMPVTGLEPVRYFYRGILSPLCLPISPYRHIVQLLFYYIGSQKSRTFCRVKKQHGYLYCLTKLLLSGLIVLTAAI